MKKLACIILSLTLITSLTKSSFALETKDNNQATVFEQERQTLAIGNNYIPYKDYLKKHDERVPVSTEIAIDLKATSDSKGTEFKSEYENEKNVLVTSDDGFVQWDIQIKEAGYYNVRLDYYPIAGRGSEITREISINGEVPFKGAESIGLRRRYVSKSDTIERDNRGNDLKPSLIEAPGWLTDYATDYMGYETDAYSFYLDTGKNTIKLRAISEPVALKSITLVPPKTASPYKEEIAKIFKKSGDHLTKGQIIKIDGEMANYRSDPMLYPISVRSSPTTDPYDASKIRLNAIGGKNWSLPNQYISWDFDVKESGYYNIALKARQKQIHGLYTNRKVYIDGAVPYEELNDLKFTYDSDWKNNVLGGEKNPFLFYLEEGKHEIKIEVTLGELGDILNELNDCVYELNRIYRNIFTVTGSTPDANRDYGLGKLLPDVITGLQSIGNRLQTVSNTLESVSQDGKSSEIAVIDRVAWQALGFASNPDNIPKILADFKTNIGSLGALLFTMTQQPLELDYIMVYSQGEVLPKAKANFVQKMVHEVKSLVASFFEDYNSVGNSYGSKEDPITVWVLTGRDQSQVLKQMIDSDFTPTTGIPVNLKLVQSTALLSSVVAGKAPDVAIQMSQAEPINYAMRNAVVNLSQFEGFEEVEGRFYNSALAPFRFENGTYAIPETQNFPMLFYRTDILSEMGIKIPNTWEDVYETIGDLQKNNLEFGVPVKSVVAGDNVNALNGGVSNSELTAYAMFLYQRGEDIYRKNGASVNFDTETSVNVFRDLCKLYSEYKLPEDYNFPNRFRTGEMPIGIADYGMYNYLSVFAPEIKGNWKFCPVPGTLTENGDINRSVASTSTGTVMLRDCKNQTAAWEFIKWWTNAQSQKNFGKELEGLMGAAARYPTANIEAMEQLPWKTEDITNLKAQWEWAKGIPEVPGGYFVPRHLKNAFRKVIDSGENPREMLEDYSKFMDEEITLKRKEFGLSTNDGN